MLRITGILLIALGIALPAGADSLTVDGQTHDNVYIVESPSMYYVHFPDTGKVTGIAKAGIPQNAFRKTADPATRKALREQWNASSERQRPQPAPAATLPLPAAPPAPPKARLYVPAPDSSAEGTVDRVRLHDVPLGRGLKAMLRAKNLDYKVEGGYLWFSSPEKLRTESMEEPETRVYTLKNAGAETLPKIPLNNIAGAAQAAPIGGGNNFGGGLGASGFGGGVGGVGSGFGGGTGMSSTPTFSNISQLFGTIDDRSVGEPPAVIGMGNLTLQGNENANYAAHNGLRNTQVPLHP
ncbi:MAG: hypothetical protein RBU21_04240 [FCB group bacterium]|jgi:hypothetical protein|nr:hypothetical protein [FCB group bacterium]